MKNKIIITSLLFIAFLTACNSGDNPVDPVAVSKLNGTWVENLVQNKDTLTLSVTLNEKSGVVTGSYEYRLYQDLSVGNFHSSNDVSGQFNDLKGTFSGSKVNLTFAEFVFDGELSSDATKITGVANYVVDSVSTPYSITLKKK